MRLNLGCGEKLLDGYVNWDRRNGHEAYPLAIEDSSCEEIRASHILEHFPHNQVSEVVNHWVGKLQPGGCLKICVPDFLKISHAYLRGEPINVQGYVFGGQTDANDYHASGYDEETLREVMANAGLERIAVTDPDANDCSALPISLNMVGYKPATTDNIDGLFAVLASARFGPALHHRCAYEAFHKLGIQHAVSVGCFWHQHLSELIEGVLRDESVRYLLTLDFDSVFNAEDVRELYRLMKAYPKADAICALQSKRSSRDALFTMQNPDGTKKAQTYRSDFDRNLIPVATGHFGLTIFDADKLRDLPRPWMVPVPAENGSWGEGRVDADISFWRKWQEQGNRLCLAPKVVAGHLEELVTWPDKNMQPIYQKAEEYILSGPPKRVFR